MRAGIPKETQADERRVAATPETVQKLIKQGFTVQIESGAGVYARVSDAEYAAAGAEIVDATAVWGTSDLILKVLAPSEGEVAHLREGTTIAAWFDSNENDAIIPLLADKKATFLALDAVPRISRAQVMDIRSSMANLAGYRAVIEAAGKFGRTVGAQVTAAGSTPPAKVLVIGAGVAGLAAIAAARGLGAQVRGFDTRAACAEQIQSLGGEFLTVEIEESGDGGGGYAKEMSPAFIAAEMALFRKQAAEVDIVITTALIPNRPAPKLWLADMVELMRPGSVVVDLAAIRGGNCELTVPGEDIVAHDVHIIGDTDLTQKMADHASRLFAKNVLNLVNELGGAKDWKIDLENPVARSITVLEAGEVRWPAPPVAVSAPAPKPAEATAEPKVEAPKAIVAPPPVHTTPHTAPHAAPVDAGGQVPMGLWAVVTTLAVGAVIALSRFAPADFLQHLTVFILAVIIGWQVIWNVKPALHTPLMSVTNAVSGIIMVGGVLQLAAPSKSAAILGFCAILFASINIFGGFAVTHRMLAMFQRRPAGDQR